ncbi:unnamed protein product [Cuscuta epithymum]|uniref:FAF domain-containing protein n=1 Tax=Cuscuta epithymum TaxID=186058 RepID=A0AAV0EYV8_9ASTE|nr:unnamed protein product [Cuscuta epithymum]
MHCLDSMAAADSNSPMMSRGGRVEWNGEKGELTDSARGFPPPLPWLARTENSSSCRMPWVLKRHYTEDGRLVITGVKSDRHEYLEAYRSGNRLRLRLVPLSVPLVGDESPHECAEEGQGGSHGGDGFDRAADAALQDRSGIMNGAGNLMTDASCGGGGGGGNKKCSNSLIIGVGVTAIAPIVHI